MAEPFSETLRALPSLAEAGDEGPRLGPVLDRLGSCAHGSAILLLALPEAIPLPVPSIGAALGVPLIAISAHLALYGERGRLPRRARDWHLPPRLARMLAERIAPAFARAERWSHPRLPSVARRERPAGLACLLFSAILFLPIPLMNLPPALGLAILAWGLVQKDGAIVALGFLYAAAMAAVMVAGAVALLRWID